MRYQQLRDLLLFDLSVSFYKSAFHRTSCSCLNLPHHSAQAPNPTQPFYSSRWKISDGDDLRASIHVMFGSLFQVVVQIVLPCVAFCGESVLRPNPDLFWDDMPALVELSSDLDSDPAYGPDNDDESPKITTC